MLSRPTRFIILAAFLFFIGSLVLVRWGQLSKVSSPDSTWQKPDPDDDPQKKLSAVLDQNFVLEIDSKKETIKSQELKKWTEVFLREYHNREELRLNSEKINGHLSSLSLKNGVQGQNAFFGSDDIGNIIELSPPTNGREIDIPGSTQLIIAAIYRGENSVRLINKEISSQITLEGLASLGITQLLAIGETDFQGSSAAREHNIKIGAKKISGKVIAPNEEFSFNDTIGEVYALSGYLPELVIKKGGLVSEYGGGLCQVSTTLFRTTMAAGLPILERHYHSLPVRYYNPQGYDATIYPGISDFRFKNDSKVPIYVQAEISGTILKFSIFGAKDGREISIKGPRIYESSPDGSMKTWLQRVITYGDGTQKTDNFYSNYKSPSLFPTIRNPLE